MKIVRMTLILIAGIFTVPIACAQFLQRFDAQLDSEGSARFIDNFGFPGETLRIIERERLGSGFRLTVNNNGASAFLTTGVNSLRKTIANDLPLDDWEGRTKTWAGIKSFFRDSVSPTEEGVNVASTTYSATKELWTEQSRAEGNVQWGMRPYSSSPYLYLNANWHDRNNVPIISNLIRYRYGFPSTGKIEAETTLTLGNSCRIVGGISLDPFRMRGFKNGGCSQSIRFEGTIRKCIFSAGTDGETSLVLCTIKI